jgi:hypothetical protein
VWITGHSGRKSHADVAQTAGFFAMHSLTGADFTEPCSFPAAAATGK